MKISKIQIEHSVIKSFNADVTQNLVFITCQNTEAGIKAFDEGTDAFLTCMDLFHTVGASRVSPSRFYLYNDSRVYVELSDGNDTIGVLSQQNVERDVTFNGSPIPNSASIRRAFVEYICPAGACAESFFENVNIQPIKDTLNQYTQLIDQAKKGKRATDATAVDLYHACVKTIKRHIKSFKPYPLANDYSLKLTENGDFIITNSQGEQSFNENQTTVARFVGFLYYQKMIDEIISIQGEVNSAPLFVPELFNRLSFDYDITSLLNLAQQSGRQIFFFVAPNNPHLQAISASSHGKQILTMQLEE